MNDIQQKREVIFRALSKVGTSSPSTDQVNDMYSRIHELEEKVSSVDQKIVSRLKELELKADSVDQKLERSEKRSDRISTLIISLVGVIAIAFFAILIQVSLDYWKYNEDRFERGTVQIQEMEKRFSDKYYTKEQFDLYSMKVDAVNNIITCIRNKGFFSMNCF